MASVLVRQMLFREERDARLKSASPPNADGSLCDDDDAIALGKFVRLLGDDDDAPARRVPDPLSRLWWEFSKHTAAACENDGFIDAVRVGAGATDVIACPSEWCWRGRVHAAAFQDVNLLPGTSTRVLFERVLAALQYGGAAATIALFNCDIDEELVTLLAHQCYDLRIMRSRVEGAGGGSWLGTPTATPQLRRLVLREVNLSAWALRDFLGGVIEAALPVELHRDANGIAFTTVLGDTADAVGSHIPLLRRLQVSSPTKTSIEGNAEAIAIWNHVTDLAAIHRDRVRRAGQVPPPPPGRRNPPGMAEGAILRHLIHLSADRPKHARFPSLRVAHRRLEHFVLENDGSPFVFCLHDASGLPRIESTELGAAGHQAELVSMQTVISLLATRAFSFAAQPRQFLPGLRDAVHFGTLVLRLRLSLPLPVVEAVLSYAIQLPPTLRVDIPQRTALDALGGVMAHMPHVMAADLATFGFGASCPVVERHMAAKWADGLHEKAGTPSVFGACCFRRFQHRRDAAQTMSHGLFVDVETALQSAGWHTGVQGTEPHWANLLNRSQPQTPQVLGLHRERVPRTRDLVEHLLPGAPIRRLSVVMDALRQTSSGHETKGSYPNDAFYGDALSALLFASPASLWISRQLTSVHFANIDSLTPDSHIQPLLDHATSLTSLSLLSAVSDRFVRWNMHSPTLRHLSVSFFSCAAVGEWDLAALETLTLESVNCVNSVTRDAYAPILRATGAPLEQPAPEKRGDSGRFAGAEFVGDTMENILMTIIGGNRHAEVDAAWAKRGALLGSLPDTHRDAMRHPVTVGVRLPALRELSLLNGDTLTADALVPELMLDITSDPGRTPRGLERIVLKNLPHIAGVNLRRAHCPYLSSVELFGAFPTEVVVADCPQVVRRRGNATKEGRGQGSAMNEPPRGGHAATDVAADSTDESAERPNRRLGGRQHR